MNRLNSVIAATAISILVLAGCNNGQQPSTQASPGAGTTTNANSTSKATQAGFDTLTTVVSNTKTAVEAGNFDQAQQAFNQFENAWVKVEDGVKTKSPKGYSAIEDTVIQVKSALKGKDKAKALGALQTLDTNITAVSKV